ncbi:MAG TPA: PaaI family thioesterase [Candidatus Dormibacteraeota bacterium]|nr:PaaI family thioesterase [Candidatus Dormibacteraeota bacterium]
MEANHGLELLRRLQLFRPPDGMWANLGMRLIEAGPGTAAIEGRFSQLEHGRAEAIHRGGVAAMADGALACAAATLVDEGEVATTVELLVDFFEPARPGNVVARGRVVHRSGHLVYCAATVEQDEAVVADAHATVALVRPA